MHRRSFRFWVILLLFALLGGAGGCTGTKPAGGDGTITVALESNILTLDPAMHRDRVTETVIRNIFDGLVTRTTEMRVVPELAESWEAVTPTEYVFQLRSDVKFHNGDQMTADDVVFTFDRILTEGMIDGQSSPRKGLLGPLLRVEKLGEYEVKFVFSEPWSLFLTMLPHQQIVPKRYTEENGDAYFAANPVGTGPFQYEGGDINEQISLKRFDDYYGGSPDIPPVGPARVAQVIFRVVPEANTRLALLLTGEAQIVTNVPPHMAEEVKSSPDAVVKTTTGTNVHYVALNVTKQPLGDIRVRKAIALAIGTEEIVQGIYGDYGVAMTGPLLPGGFGKNTELRPVTRDCAAAKALLADAGYSDGFSLVIDTEDSMKDDADAVAAHLREAGIEASVRVWEWGVLKPLLLDGSRSVLLNYYGNASMDPYDLLNPVFMTGGRGNYTHYSNSDLDALLELAAVEIDPAERESMYREAEKIIHDDYLWVMTYTRKVLEACSTKIENWVPSPDGRINLHDVQLKE